MEVIKKGYEITRIGREDSGGLKCFEEKDPCTGSNIIFFCLDSYSRPHIIGIKAGWFGLTYSESV